MASYQYTALTAAGERVSGMLAAANEQSVLAELESRRLTPIQVDEQGEKSGLRIGRMGGFGGGRGGVSTRRLALAYTQLADLLRAGVPLMRGLRLLGGSKSSPRMAGAFAELADAVAEGRELAEAMEARPETFGKVHIAMVKAGEKGGFLEQVLARLGQFLLAQADMRSRVMGSLIYPVLLVIVGTGVMAGVFGFLIPRFKPLFARLQEEGTLPWLTKVVLGVSDTINHYGLWIGIALIVAGIAAWRVSKRPEVARWVAKAKTRAPVVGPINRSICIARFCRILGTMLGNSIPLMAAMQIARDAAGNVLLEEAIDEATEAVRHGQPLAPPLAASGLIDADVVEMIAVGESANNLDDVMITVATTLEQRIDRTMNAAVKLIEPLMILALAAVIGIVAVALILPMSKLGQTIH